MNASHDGYEKGSEPYDYEIIECDNARSNKIGIIKDTIGIP